MSANTSIEWTDRTWNPVRGCALVSDGCRNCYAMKQAHRFSGPGRPYEGLTELGPAGPRWTGKVRLVFEALEEPLGWRKPRRIFVNSMSDLFHEDVPDAFIDQAFAVMALASRHTFQILTKRPARMCSYLTSAGLDQRIAVAMCLSDGWDAPSSDGVDLVLWRRDNSDRPIPAGLKPWPLPNVWLGVSAENQQTADERIPLLLQTPAAVRFVSAEPLLGPIDLREIAVPDEHAGKYAGHAYTFNALQREDDLTMFNAPAHLDLVIAGGESGARPRPCEVAWVSSLVRQCRDAGVAAFVKQLGANVVDRNDAGFEGDTPRSWPMDTDTSETADVGYQGAPVRVRLHDRKGGDMAEWPKALRVRELPGIH